MDSKELSVLGGVLLSLLFSYTPRLREWFAAKDSTTKSLLMLAMLLAVAVGALLYRCNLGAACITDNWREYATALFLAAIANQSTYSISPTHPAVKDVKANKEIPAMKETPGPVTEEAPKEAAK